MLLLVIGLFLCAISLVALVVGLFTGDTLMEPHLTAILGFLLIVLHTVNDVNSKLKNLEKRNTNNRQVTHRFNSY